MWDIFCPTSLLGERKMEEKNNFFCYSLRLFYFLRSFDQKCYGSKINKVSNNRYWVFKKSQKLDEIIEFYREVKYKFN